MKREIFDGIYTQLLAVRCGSRALTNAQFKKISAECLAFATESYNQLEAFHTSGWTTTGTKTKGAGKG